MKQVKPAIIKLLIVFISAFCIDGGRVFLLINNPFQIEFSETHSQDIETPHQHHFNSHPQDEQIAGMSKIDFSNPGKYLVNFQYNLFFPSQEFLNSIWQPPRLS